MLSGPQAEATPRASSSSLEVEGAAAAAPPAGAPPVAAPADMSSQPLLAAAPPGPHVGVCKMRKSYSSACTAALAQQCRQKWGQHAVAAFFWVAPPALGLLLGLLLPACNGLPQPFHRISTVIGWVYFSAWSISFYPQLVLNYQRKSVSGLSLDFQVLNMLGFSCYAVYNSALFWNTAVRAEYAQTHGGNLPAVHANDVFFAIHAAILTACTLVQCAIYPRGGSRVHPAALAACAGVAVSAVAYAAAVVLLPPVHCGDRTGAAAGEGSCFGRWLTWLSWLYFLSYVKLAVSLVKYVPQVVLNHRLRSTVGFNIFNVLLDLEGGLLSLAQQLMDSAVLMDWGAITGNPVKFGLGLSSFVFDFIFMCQHWVIFPGGKDPDAMQLYEEPQRPGLLPWDEGVEEGEEAAGGTAAAAAEAGGSTASIGGESAALLLRSGT